MKYVIRCQLYMNRGEWEWENYFGPVKQHDNDLLVAVIVTHIIKARTLERRSRE